MTAGEDKSEQTTQAGSFGQLLISKQNIFQFYNNETFLIERNKSGVNKFPFPVGDLLSFFLDARERKATVGG